MSLLNPITDFFRNTWFSLESSPWLVKKLINYTGGENQRGITILELGGGNGVVTEAIKKILAPDSKLFVFEVREEMIQKLRDLEQDNVQIIHGKAEDIHLHQAAESVDIVLSTLPLGSLSRELTISILDKVNLVLRPNGCYVQFQYALQNLWDIRRIFHVEKVGFEPRNFWPAFVYLARKK